MNARWVVTAAHLHSTWSYDGRYSLPSLRALLGRWAGVLLMTEHDRGFSQDKLDDYVASCADASDPGILIVPGIEYSDATNTIHLLVWGASRFYGEGLQPQEVLEAARADGARVVFAHPARKNAWRRFDDAWAESLFGIEAWNRKSDGLHPSRHARSLLRRTGAVPFVGMDFHTRRQLFPLFMRVRAEGELNAGTFPHLLRDRGSCVPFVGPAPFAWFGVGPARIATASAEWMRRRAVRVARRGRGPARGDPA